MTLHVTALPGCRPTPLAHYLKALGVLRLVSEQCDADARGFWEDEVFHLATGIDREELKAFFLERYVPTPLVAPWNGGSGFYPKDTKSGIEPLAKAKAARFEPYRRAIAAAQALVAGRSKRPQGAEKVEMLRQARARWSGTLLDWLSAALVITDGKKGVRYPAVLGTGGNDGRLDFTNNQMQRLVDLFDVDTGAPRDGAGGLVDAALYAENVHDLPAFSVGQFYPGAAGGANSGLGFSGSARVNPWDFILMLEGAVLLEVAAVRRLDAAGLPQAAAPFAVRAQAEGYASAAPKDEVQTKGPPRGEQWLPLWARPASLPEVRALFVEGRMQTGRHRARRALDAARAVSLLGVSRGITAFERYAFAERNGQSTLAVPIGRWPVSPEPRVRLLDEIDDWVSTLRRRASGKGAPASLDRAVRQIEGSMFAVCREPRPERWGALLEALGATEDLIAARPKAAVDLRLRPLPKLSLDWALAADDGSPELRLAVALASQSAPWDPRGDDPRQQARRLGPIRANCLPLERARFQRFAANARELVHDPSVVWSGRNLIADLSAIALRRITDGNRVGHEGFPLGGLVSAPLDDVDAFLSGRVDDARLGRLARGLMAVGWRRGARTSVAEHWPDDTWPPPMTTVTYGLFRLLYVPLENRGEDAIRPDAAPLRLLASGRLDDATRTAIRRLGALGYRPKLRQAVGSPELARRLAAALAFPVSARQRKLLRHRVSRPGDENHQRTVSTAP